MPDDPLRALVGVHLASPDATTAFESLLRASPIVVEAMHVTGPTEYVLRVTCTEIAQLDDLVRALHAYAGVRDVDAQLILRTVA